MLLVSYLRHHYLTEGHKDLLTYFLLRVFILLVLVFRIKIIYVLDTEMDETKYVNGNAGGHMHTTFPGLSAEKAYEQRGREAVSKQCTHLSS